jgi:hypothetical protein
MNISFDAGYLRVHYWISCKVCQPVGIILRSIINAFRQFQIVFNHYLAGLYLVKISCMYQELISYDFRIYYYNNSALKSRPECFIQSKT